MGNLDVGYGELAPSWRECSNSCRQFGDFLCKEFRSLRGIAKYDALIYLQFQKLSIRFVKGRSLVNKLESKDCFSAMNRVFDKFQIPGLN